MKVFLAGAAGVIGRILIPLLIADGVEVVGTTRSPERESLVRALGAMPVIVNALDRERLIAAVTGARPDVIMHQLTDLRGGSFADNARLRIEGTRNLVDAARAAGVSRLIAESISWCYVPGAGPAHEQEPLDVDAPSPRRETVAAVQALEQAVLALPDGVVLRYGILYGAGTCMPVRAGSRSGSGGRTCQPRTR
jgi:nucleoside-diphosphate-sugar epimerase